MKIIYKVIFSVFLVIAAPAPVHAHFLSFLNPVGLFSWVCKSTANMFRHKNHLQSKSWLSVLSTWIWKKKPNTAVNPIDVEQSAPHHLAPIVPQQQQQNNNTQDTTPNINQQSNNPESSPTSSQGLFHELILKRKKNCVNVLKKTESKKNPEKSLQITEKPDHFGTDTVAAEQNGYKESISEQIAETPSHTISTIADSSSCDSTTSKSSLSNISNQKTTESKIESDSQQSDDEILPEASCTQSTTLPVIIQDDTSEQTSNPSGNSEQAELKKLQDIRPEIEKISNDLSDVQTQQIEPGSFCNDALKRLDELQSSIINCPQDPDNIKREKKSISLRIMRAKKLIEDAQNILPALSDTPLTKEEQAAIKENLTGSKSLFEPKKAPGYTVSLKNIKKKKKVVAKKSRSNPLPPKNDNDAAPSIDLYEEGRNLIKRDQVSRLTTGAQQKRSDNLLLRGKLDLLNTKTAGRKAVSKANGKITETGLTTIRTQLVIKTVPAIALLKGLLLHTFYIHYPHSNTVRRLVPEENRFFRLLVTFLNKNIRITDIDTPITIGEYKAPLLHQVIEDPENCIAHLGITIDPIYSSDMSCFSHWLIHALLVVGVDIYEIHKHKNPLMLAAVKNHPLATLSLLQQGGININAKNPKTRSASALLKLLQKKNGKTAQEQTADTQTVMDLLKLGARLDEDEKGRLNEKNFIHNTAALEKYNETHQKIRTGWFTSSPSLADRLYNQANQEKDLKELEHEFSDLVLTDDAGQPLIDDPEQHAPNRAIPSDDMTNSMRLAVAAQTSDLRTIGEILETDPLAATREKQGGWTFIHAAILNPKDRVENGTTETLDFVKRKLIEKNVSPEIIKSTLNTQVTLKNGGKATGGQLLLRKQLCTSYAK